MQPKQQLMAQRAKLETRISHLNDFLSALESEKEEEVDLEAAAAAAAEAEDEIDKAWDEHVECQDWPEWTQEIDIYDQNWTEWEWPGSSSSSQGWSLPCYRG